MIWYDIKELERELANEEVSDRKVFNYLLVSMVATTLIPYLSGTEYGNKWLSITEAVISLLVTLILLKVTFDINNNGDNKDYFKRFISLSLVSGIRLIVFAIPIGVIMYFARKYFVDNQNSKDIFNLLLTTIFGVMYYFILTNSFRRVNIKK